MKAWIAAVALLTLSSCIMSLQDRMDREAVAFAKIVKIYCNETTSPELRDAFGKAVNNRTAPDTITVHCACVTTNEKVCEVEKP